MIKKYQVRYADDSELTIVASSDVVYKSKSGREEKATEEIRTTLNAWECKYWLFDAYCKRLDVAEVVSITEIQ